MPNNNMNIGAAFKLSREPWAKLAVKAMAFIKTRTQKGRGVRLNDRGYNFPAYDPGYAKRKARGMTKLSGGKYAGFEGVATDRQTSPPNFRLRNVTMRDLKRLALSVKSVVVGWRGESATIINAHMDKKKYMVAGVTKKEQKELLKEFDVYFDKQWKKKTNNVVIEVKL